MPPIYRCDRCMPGCERRHLSDARDSIKIQNVPPREICDTAKNTEALVCLSAQSRKEVDEVVRKAVAAGGKTFNDPQDFDFMYGHAFHDVDGHIWELAYMEPSAIKQS